MNIASDYEDMKIIRPTAYFWKRNNAAGGDGKLFFVIIIIILFVSFIYNCI